MGRFVLVAALLVTLGAARGGARVPVTPTAVRSGTGPSTAVTYVAPLGGSLRVLRSFDLPATPYGPGHLGVDLAAAGGTAVRSAGTGVVTFAGAVAGRGVLVVRHADGIRTEYEPVRVLVRVGSAVRRGQAVAVVEGLHRSCGSISCLHWGARRGTLYLDPLALLQPLAPVRLLPWPRGG